MAPELTSEDEDSCPEIGKTAMVNLEVFAGIISWLWSLRLVAALDEAAMPKSDFFCMIEMRHVTISFTI